MKISLHPSNRLGNHLPESILVSFYALFVLPSPPDQTRQPAEQQGDGAGLGDACDTEATIGGLRTIKLTGSWVSAAALSSGRTQDQAYLLEVLQCPLLPNGKPPFLISFVSISRDTNFRLESNSFFTNSAMLRCIYFDGNNVYAVCSDGDLMEGLSSEIELLLDLRRLC